MSDLRDLAPLLRPGVAWERADAARDGWSERLPALHESLREAVGWVCRMRPFLTEVVVRLRFAFTYGVASRAHRADGVVLVSPDLWDGIDAAGRTWLLAEAALSFACDQLRRGSSRHQAAWAAACLHTNARLLRKARLRPPPAIAALVTELDALLGGRSDPRADAAVYEALHARFAAGAAGRLDGASLPLQLPSTEELLEAEREGNGLLVRPGSLWRAALERGMYASGAHGLLPSDVERAVRDGGDGSRVDWRTVLRRRLGALDRERRTYGRANRRRLHLDRNTHGHGRVLPPGWSRAMAPVALAIDSSGSMRADDIAVLRAELQAIADLAGRPLRVLVSDAFVHVDEMARDLTTVRVVGGGGTSAIPVLERLAESPPAALVYATDLAMEFPEVAPEYPVYWLVRRAPPVAPPFGEVVVREEDGT